MEAEHPHAFARPAHRTVTHCRTQQLAFHLVVGDELVAAPLLWARVVAVPMAIG